MELSNIAQFLEIYKKKLSLEGDKREELIRVIFDSTGIKVEESQMTITKGVIQIKMTPIVKNELFLHKAKILEKIKASGRTDIHDIQ